MQVAIIIIINTIIITHMCMSGKSKKRFDIVMQQVINKTVNEGSIWPQATQVINLPPLCQPNWIVKNRFSFPSVNASLMQFGIRKGSSRCSRSVLTESYSFSVMWRQWKCPSICFFLPSKSSSLETDPLRRLCMQKDLVKIQSLDILIK